MRMKRFGKTDKAAVTTGGLLGPDDDPPMLRLGLPRRLIQDAYHYLVGAPWPEVLLWIALAFASVNAIFALGYLLVGGVANVRPGSFGDAFFFSVQTLSTIGYGVMVPQSGKSNLLVAVEAFSGGVGLALMTGLVFAKFSRPTSRVKFSKVAVIGNHRGRKCLMFRMANEREDRIVQPQLYAVVLRSEDDDEGRNFIRVHDLELARDRHAFLSLTWLVIHPIDDHSPLHDATPDSLRRDRVAVIISMVGIDEGLSQTVYAHYTYRPHDIRWNTRFVDVIKPRERGGWLIDYALFDDVVEPS
jgi:inward rectifier potassium channel